MHSPHALALAALLALGTASGGAQAQASLPAEASAASAAALALPATYTGTLPCADCPGIAYHLNLQAARKPYSTTSGRYELRQRYLVPRSKVMVERGPWQLAANGSTITLGKGAERRLLRLGPGGALTLLDQEGHAIASNLNYTLERARTFVSLQDAERAEKLATSDAPLENTYWKLVALGGQPTATPTNGQREAHLVLQAGPEARLSGSGGCNRLMGNYERKGDALRFPPVAATRMGCPEGMEQETAFLHALEQVAALRIKGRQLELLDAAGIPILRFEATPQR
ncbi:MAG TPA: META domain-containing protein [Burkholderiaceae bacterium]